MKINVAANATDLGVEAAKVIAEKINKAIQEKGEARIVLSTGASQFETLSALLKQNVDWQKVTMFHLDEYIGLPETHIASFRKYLKSRFISFVNLKEAVLVNGEADTKEEIARLTEKLRVAPIDVGVIGIGQNAHIAFNDPPADFETKEVYIAVNLDENCKKQQVSEGWFATVDDVPKQAISMTPYQIMQCKTIVSPVPHASKADAIKKVLESSKVDNNVPATLLKTHNDFQLFIDANSAAKTGAKFLK